MKKEKQLRYYDGTHTYYYGRQRLKSVTTFIGEFFSKFDTRGMAKTISNGFKFRNRKKEKEGIEVCDLDKKKATMRYWINLWKEAANSGTRIHEAIERYILAEIGGGYIIPEDEVDKAKFQQGVTFIDTLPQFERTYLNPEVKVFDTELGLAGCIDLLINNEDGTVSLCDWKSNKRIDTKSRDKKVGKTPISHLEDCNYNKYALQLSLYAYILERKGMKIRELIIVHLKEDEYIPMTVPYMKKEVETILEVKND